MEDGEWLSREDKALMQALKDELAALKVEHKEFAGRKSSLTKEDKEKWRVNSVRTNEIFVLIKDLRFKNLMQAGNA